jgi:methylenetetrahydrofolate reductase (NADPH)
MTFQEKLQKGKFMVTAEVDPSKGVDFGGRLSDLDLWKGRVDALNVTDGKSSVMTMTPLALGHILKERGFEPILNLSCRDRNRLSLQADVLGAAALGIRNFLVLTGDYASLGDHPQAKPVFDLDSVQLLQIMEKMKNGQDMEGNVLCGAPDLFTGATVSPCPGTAAGMDLQLIKMEKKIAAGAKFFQTQPVFDVKRFERFMKKAKEFGVPVLTSVLALKSASMARFINRNMPGIFVPENLIAEMEKAKDRVKTSLEICVRLIQDFKGLCQGVHFIPVLWEKRVPAILDAAKL